MDFQQFSWMMEARRNLLADLILVTTLKCYLKGRPKVFQLPTDWLRTENPMSQHIDNQLPFRATRPLSDDEIPPKSWPHKRHNQQALKVAVPFLKSP
ncbi:hypothetical protein BV899_17215 [Alcaligenes phenolicus]|nr:hypothetical protein BV899_17215 [Alcaligenes phenolicus]